MDYTTCSITFFLDRLPEELSRLNPCHGYIAAEYCFLYQCAEDPVIRTLYLDVINVPSLRAEYIAKHHEVFLSFLPCERFNLPKRDVFFSTVTMCASKFQMMEQYAATLPELTFDDAFACAFEVRMALLDLPHAERAANLTEGFRLGRSIVGDVMLGV